jgi:hypothetical protein
MLSSKNHSVRQIHECKGPQIFHSLLERDETRRVGGTDTGSTVLDGLVGDGKFGQL